MSPVIIIATLAGFVLLMIFISLVTWYRKCPSDRIMIIYGKTDGTLMRMFCLQSALSRFTAIWRGRSEM